MSLPLPGESECDCGLHEFCESPHICSMMMRFGMFPTNEEIDKARLVRSAQAVIDAPPDERSVEEWADDLAKDLVKHND